MPSVDSIGIISSNFTAIVDMILKGETFTDCLDFLEQQAKSKYPNATTGSINNCRGRWFEVMLTYLCNYQLRNSNLLFLKLGTASEHSIFDIFLNTESQLNKLLAQGHTLNLSIPDLIVLNIESLPNLKKWKEELCNLSTKNQGKEITAKILSGYQNLTNIPVEFKFCKALCSIKTSLRPDRKYQAMYEAEFVKAFQKKFFPDNKISPKYIMVGPLEARATIAILEKNLSLISIAADGNADPQPTIDRVCIVNNVNDLNKFTLFCQSLK